MILAGLIIRACHWPPTAGPLPQSDAAVGALAIDEAGQQSVTVTPSLLLERLTWINDPVAD
jgi:hypothetical protein